MNQQGTIREEEGLSPRKTVDPAMLEIRAGVMVSDDGLEAVDLRMFMGSLSTACMLTLPQVDALVELLQKVTTEWRESHDNPS